MSSSEVIFKNQSKHLKDAALGTFLDIIQKMSLSDNNKANQWIREACEEWQAIWFTMPPGLKDIELDHVLTDSQRLQLFEKLVDKVLLQVKDDPTGAEFLVREITKVKQLIYSNSL